jgi:hypothetical protein
LEEEAMRDTELFELGLTSPMLPVPAFGPQVMIGTRAATSEGIVVLYGDTAFWVFETTRRLESLGHFKCGWNSHRGRPLRPESRDQVVRTLDYLRRVDLPVPNVVLGPEGNVHFEWRGEGKELEVELQGDVIDYVKVTPSADIIEGKTRENVPVAMSRLTQWLICE